jgi:hypothetical protein
MLVVRVTENVRSVQSSYYSSCPLLARLVAWDDGLPFSWAHMAAYIMQYIYSLYVRLHVRLLSFFSVVGVNMDL